MCIIQEERNSSLTWDLEVEVAKVIDKGVALGYNFNKNEKNDVNEVDRREVAGVVSVSSGIERYEREVHLDKTMKMRGRNKVYSIKKHEERSLKLSWNLEEEIAKVIETGVALGFNFNGKEKEIGGEVARREMEDEEKLRPVNQQLLVVSWQVSFSVDVSYLLEC
ncbi:hypothetical protein LWI28_014499 [Acer negundo]|uniref:Uncharacterized protein n=1 Tax=Acer negundo TaxID=4023 RepID=A0AAD5NY37_ACENE|nr:hypothetical protein LWI28_014499 [Acer negundo]